MEGEYGLVNNVKGEYKTVFKTVSAQIVEKKSKFIAYVGYAPDEDNANIFIEQIKTMHRDARHNVYAYSIMGDLILQRHNDDGEPTGTGGIPVMEAIKAKGIHDVVIVVTRYFGGILLGKGGLARAYGRAAALGLDECHIVKKLLCEHVTLDLDYGQMGKLQAFITENGFYIDDIKYQDNVEMNVFVPKSKMPPFMYAINNITSGEIDIRPLGNRYIITEDDGRLLSVDA